MRPWILSGAELTLLAIPEDPDAPAEEGNDLVVAATAGEGEGSSLDHIPVAQTTVGDAFVQRTPGRFDSIELAPGEITRTGRPLCCRYERRIRSPVCWWLFAKRERDRSAPKSST